MFFFLLFLFWNGKKHQLRVYWEESNSVFVSSAAECVTILCYLIIFQHTLTNIHFLFRLRFRSTRKKPNKRNTKLLFTTQSNQKRLSRTKRELLCGIFINIDQMISFHFCCYCCCSFVLLFAFFFILTFYYFWLWLLPN